MRKRHVVGAIALCLLGFVWVNNTNLWTEPESDRPGVLAHRGLGQTFDPEGVRNDTCTAERIHQPEHEYLENTVEGMRAAFDAGADVVELDIHRTSDERFAVFHDWELDCRTDLSGSTREFTMAQLRKADIGYGYTDDGGRTYPFRGKAVGMMPELGEVLGRFGDRSLLLHVKSNDPAEGELLAERLAVLPVERRERITVYGGDAPIAALRERLPGLRVMSKQLMTRCLLAYEDVGWSGHVPKSCSGIQLHLPKSYARWLWGWPAKFTERMAKVDTRVVLVAGSGGFSEGFDTPAALSGIPVGFDGLIWTNRADLLTAPTR